MNQKEAGEKLKIINNYNLAQPIQHLSLKQEKKLYAERLERREKTVQESKERVAKEPKTVWLNTLRKRLPVSEITTQMMEAEENFWEYLHNND